MEPYTIRQHGTNILIVSLHGFWNDNQLIAFQSALTWAVRRLMSRSFYAVVDLSDVPPQSAAVILGQGETVAALVAMGLKKLFFFGESALLRLQVKRATAATDTVFVSSLSEALAAMSSLTR